MNPLRFARYFPEMLVTAILLTACLTQQEEPSYPSIEAYQPQAQALFGAVIRPSITTVPLDSVSPLTLSPLRCVETSTQTLVCQGWVENSLDVAVTDTLLHVDLVDDAGIVADTQTVSPSRNWLMPNTGAPYRVIFSIVPTQPVTPHLSLVRAAVAPSDPPVIELPTSNIQMQVTGEQVQIKGEVVNPTAEAMKLVTVAVTVFNPQGEVAGFREIEIRQLGPGASTHFETSILAAGISAEQVTVTADGFYR